MRRFDRHSHKIEHDNVQRWLVSYADYMTLLFALFVVLYAFAVTNQHPYQLVTDSLEQVFKGTEKSSNQAIITKEHLNNPSDKPNQPSVSIKDNQQVNNLNTTASEQDSVESLHKLKEDLHKSLFELIDLDYAKLTLEDDWLEIELNSGLLFASGSATPTKAAYDILSVVATIVASRKNFIRVRGYTDDQYISNELFSSNWELSVFRATAILRLLEQLAINPARMVIEGYGQYSPIADNTTAQGRSKNRRVVIAISKFEIKDSAIKTNKPIEKIEEKIKNIVEDNQIKVIKKSNGGILITTRYVENEKKISTSENDRKIGENND